MYHIIVLSHGGFAAGLKSTINMFMGEVENTAFLSFELSQNADAFREEVAEIFMKIPKEDAVLFLTDIYGGTPNKVATEMKIRFGNRVEVLSGVNLPMVASAVTLMDGNLDSIAMDTIMMEYNKALVRTVIVKEMDEEDE